MDGDGDFRSEEVTALRDEADMVITNPPFSLFREFVSWMNEGGVEFLVIGNMNAISYKEIFPLIKDNKVWLGASKVGLTFKVPSSYPLTGSSCREDSAGNKFIYISNASWFTNIVHGRRKEPLELLNMEDNKRFNNSIKKKPNSYKKYDNYDAIEVPVTNGIPSDYDGVMGVPISFLHKYCPEQFEIVSGWNGGKTAPNPGAAVTPYLTKTGEEKFWNGPTVEKKATYFRVLIRHLTSEDSSTH